jgi:hypothetical protein
MRIDGRTDGQADIKKLIVAFRNFANVSKMACNNANRTGIAIEVDTLVQVQFLYAEDIVL